MSDIIEIARRYATKCHQETNHYYGDGYPYSFHLNMVYLVGIKFKHLIPDNDMVDVALAACWTHDVIEDTRQTYNDVKNATNARVANVSYALANEKGKNRKERANFKYYEGIKSTQFATFVKLCDRIANVQYSKKYNDSGMYKMYKKENDKFVSVLYCDTYSEMFTYLKELFKDEI